MNKTDFILNYFDELIPNPICELNYNEGYQLVIAVMLSAQTTDKRVNIVTKVLFTKYNGLKELKEAPLEDIKAIVRELGNYNKKAKAVMLIAKIIDEEYRGIVPNKRKLLESLPMVGRKSTNVILSELYNIPNIAVDTHVKRVSIRLGIAKETDSLLEIENKLKRKIIRSKWSKAHHQMVLFGRYYCLARSPKCEECKLKKICKYKKSSD